MKNKNPKLKVDVHTTLSFNRIFQKLAPSPTQLRVSYPALLIQNTHSLRILPYKFAILKRHQVEISATYSGDDGMCLLTDNKVKAMRQPRDENVQKFRR